jgi:hypothetical protein
VWPRDGDGERVGEFEDECLRLRRPRAGEEPVVVVLVDDNFNAGGADSGPVFLRRSSSPQWEISTGTLGRSLPSTGTFVMVLRTDCPETRWPKTVCLPFRWEESSRVMKNLEDGSVR